MIYQQLDHLLDVPLDVEAVVEGDSMTVRDLMALSVGGIVTSSRPAGENVDIFAGQSFVGAGELAQANGRRVLRMVKFKAGN